MSNAKTCSEMGESQVAYIRRHAQMLAHLPEPTERWNSDDGRRPRYRVRDHERGELPSLEGIVLVGLVVVIVLAIATGWWL